ELAVASVEVLTVPGVRQLVEDDDLVAAGREPLDEVRADEAGTAGYEDAHSPTIVAHRRFSRQSRRPSRQCGMRGAPGRALRSTEYAGRGAGRPSSSELIRRTRHSSPASSKIASANSAHVQSPSAARCHTPRD